MLLAEGPSGEQVRNIAVVGSGVAGLSAAWLLSRRHRVTLYEANDRVGGHANTVRVPTPKGLVAVDTGFIVYNERNYPELTAFFRHLDVPTQDSEMSFGASIGDGRLEYSSVGLNGLIGQRANLFRPRFWAMLRDVIRFYNSARGLLERPELEDLKLGEYLDRSGYTQAFIEDHLLPMGAAIWSTTAQQMRDYPLLAFVRFFASHGLIDLVNRPIWRTVTGGSREYVNRVLSDFAGTVRLGARVTGVRRGFNQVHVSDATGDTSTYTDVVIASHGDQALHMLADPDAAERTTLSAFRYTPNTAVLHTDTSVMPRRRHVWASWNYMGGERDGGDDPLCVTYWMNRLQTIDTPEPLLLTLNPSRPIAPEKVLRSFEYTHPLFDHAAIAAQQNLWQLQGHRNTWFCGSYFGYGFHEDGLQSGLAVAEALGGVSRPWPVIPGSSRIASAPELEEAA